LNTERINPGGGLIKGLESEPRNVHLHHPLELFSNTNPAPESPGLEGFRKWREIGDYVFFPKAGRIVHKDNLTEEDEARMQEESIEKIGEGMDDELYQKLVDELGEEGAKRRWAQLQAFLSLRR
jgi:hypothetical protein